MEQFPPLSQWFNVRCQVPTNQRYTRYDLCIKDDLTAEDLDALSDELALVIARLRLNSRWYSEWLKYWKNGVPIPPEWKRKFQDQFWRVFISDKATERRGSLQFDERRIRGYIGELILYLIQIQLYHQRIDAAPRKPKAYSKDSGIDCLELCGDREDYASLHYIAWECKATTDDTPDNFTGKIYAGHLQATSKSFRDSIDLLSDRYNDDRVLGRFIEEMIDDFYSSPPSIRKRFGGCVTYSAECFASPGAFSRFGSRFRDKLREDKRCRQVRLCSVGDLNEIIQQVKEKIWSKLRL